jgi:hypothetical protein
MPPPMCRTAPQMSKLLQPPLDALSSGPYLGNYPWHRSAFPLFIKVIVRTGGRLPASKPRLVEDL